MIPRSLPELLPRVVGIGADPADSDEVRLQKSLMVTGSLMFIAAGLLWGVLYIVLGETLAGLIPISYAAVSLLSIIHFGLTRRYRFFRRSQFVLILFLPFLLQLALGGFINGSGVILWALLAPLGALLFTEPRRAPLWMAAYLSVVAAGGLLQPFLRPDNNLSPSLVTAFFVMNVGAVSAIVFVLLFYFVEQRNVLQGRSDNLLLSILPRDVAKILKREVRTIADTYDEASILFADVADFTPLTAAMTPVEVVELLNAVFSDFDDLVAGYRLEKIKTIGDAYMVAAGVPQPRADHAHILAEMALAMRELVGRKQYGGRELSFRIGINSGPVVAGVIGRGKFSYDMWGDTVNTASRMESHGLAGEIQVTEATYRLLAGDYEFAERGLVEVKGKGDMRLYLLRGKKSGFSEKA